MGDPRDLLEHAPIAVRCVNADGSIAWANRAELGLFLREAGAHSLFREEQLFVEREAYQGLLRDVRSGRTVESRPMKVDLDDGGAFEAIVSMIPLPEQNGWLTYTAPRGLDRRALDRIQRMQAAAVAIADATTEWEAAALAAKLGSDGLDAPRAGVWLMSRAGDELKLFSNIGFPEKTLEKFQRIPLDLQIDLPLLTAVRTRQALWIGSRQELEAAYPIFANNPDLTLPDYAVVCLPLIVEAETVGALCFMFSAQRTFNEEERSFGHLLARHCAQALNRSRVDELKSSLREDAERVRRRLTLLANASSAFAEAGLDVGAVLQTVAERATELMGDFCSIRLISDDPRFATMPAFADRKPDAMEMLKQLTARTKLVADRGSLLYAVENPQPLLAATVDPKEFREQVQAEYRPFVDRFPVYSVMLVPLRAHGKVLGALTMARHDPGHPYTEDDLTFLQDIADRAALSIVNARQHEELAAERQMLDAVLRQMPSGVMIVDGLTRRVLLTNGRRELESSALPLERSLARGEVVYGEEVVVSREGSSDTTFRISSGPVRDRQGRVVAAVATYEDVSAQKIAEERLRFLSEASRVLGSSLEHKTTIAHVARIFPLHLAETCTVHLAANDATLSDDTPLPGVTAFADRKVVSNEHSIAVPIAFRDRVFGSLLLETKKRRFDRGDIELAEELASRFAFAIENADLYQRAQAAVRIRDDFLSIASHELKTPLAALELLVTALLRAARVGKLEPEKLASRLTRATEQTARLSSLINSLLDVSRIAAGRVTLNLEEVDVSALAKEVAERFEHVAERAGSPLQLEVGPGIIAQCDRSRIDQVITNLLGNAIKYGRGQPIDVTVATRGHQVAISVRDHGIGIDPQDQARIFGRFERAASARHYGGLGLGLWIVSQIAEAHGGSVSVKSLAGEGSTFELQLPLRVVPGK